MLLCPFRAFRFILFHQTATQKAIAVRKHLHFGPPPWGELEGATIATRKHLHFSPPPSGELEGAIFLYRIYKGPCMIYRNVWCNAMS